MNTKILFSLALACALSSTWAADFSAALDGLIPRLAAPKVEDRYGAQMELQAIASQTSVPGQEADRASLAKLLSAKAIDATVPQPARVWLVRQLEYMGADESVASLTQLLTDTDAELRECARRALEKNPAPAATAPLQAALEKGGEPAWQIGLINSLGERKDADAVSTLAKFTATPATARVAAAALAKIADKPALASLWDLHKTQSAMAQEALVAAGNTLQAKGDAAGAKEIYQKLFTPENPLPIRIAAFSGLVQADPKWAAKYIPEALTSPDRQMQSVAVQAALKTYGKSFTKTMIPLLGTLSVGAKMQVLPHLDATAEKQLLAAAQDAEEAVRLVALESLGRTGTAASIPALIQAATSDARSERNTAETALSRISGPGAAEALAKQASGGEPKARAAAIRALAARQQKTAYAALLTYAAEPVETVNQAAYAALGRVGGDAQVEGLAALALESKNPAAFVALTDVANRVQDKNAAAKKILARAKAASAKEMAAVMGVLAILGGPESLKAVTQHIKESELQDAAVRALSNWPDFSAAPSLLQIAKDAATSDTHRILALQGAIRLAKSSENEPPQARLDLAQAALTTATRLEDKKSAISAIGEIAHPQAAATLKTLLNDAALKNEAGLAGLNMAQILAESDKAIAKDLVTAIKAANLSQNINRRADNLLRKL